MRSEPERLGGQVRVAAWEGGRENEARGLRPVALCQALCTFGDGFSEGVGQLVRNFLGLWNYGFRSSLRPL